jgi:hypothetical protein
LIYEIKEACWWLKNNGYEIHMIWIPFHVETSGNARAGDSVEIGIE